MAIIEDEDRFAKELEGFLLRYAQESGKQFQITRFSDGLDIAEDYGGGFDLLLMDIQMKHMDGMTAAEKIRERDSQVMIIFITNRNDFAIRGYEVDALDYVLKPVTYYIFTRKLQRALSRISAREGFLVTIGTRDGVRRIRSSELYYVESEGHNLVYHTAQGDFSTRERMKDAEKNLVGNGFFRSNKGVLVNMSLVEGVEDGCCVIRGEKLPISRARKNEFMAEFMKTVGD